MDISEIDDFLAAPKKLIGPPPEWQQSSRPNELEATWNIEDELGIVRSQLRFRCNNTDNENCSVSLIFRSVPIWRVDFVPLFHCEPNLPDGAVLGLPPTVCGNHSHDWPDNREYVASEAKSNHLPYRRELPRKVRKLSQAILWLSDKINLTITPDQRGFDVPPQRDLFARGI